MPLFSSSNPNSGEPYGPPSDGGDDDSKFNAMLAAYRPLLTKLTFSSVMGYCSAITAKKIGKGIAFVAGLGFMALQGMAYAGFVDVNWKEVEKSVANAVDTVSTVLCIVHYLLAAIHFYYHASILSLIPPNYLASPLDRIDLEIG